MLVAGGARVESSSRLVHVVTIEASRAPGDPGAAAAWRWARRRTRFSTRAAPVARTTTASSTLKASATSGRVGDEGACGCVAVDATPGEVHDVGGARNVVRGQPTGRWPLWHFGTGFTESARTPYFRDVAIIQKPSFEVSVDGGGRWSVVHGDRMEVGVGEDNDGGGACGEDGGFPVRVVVDAIEALRLRGGGRDDGRGARRGARGGVEGAAAWR